jgi:DAK2 domain fusion protein YloV
MLETVDTPENAVLTAEREVSRMPTPVDDAGKVYHSVREGRKRMVDTKNAPSILTGAGFHRLVVAGTRCVEQHVEAINALNVFPVPDGDTGINMFLTLRSGESSSEIPSGPATVAEVSNAVAKGTLLGARGNSGVIFSQFLRGLATALRECDECDASTMATAIAGGAAAAYKAVSQPVEGTMLTVMRAAGEEAQRSSSSSLEDMWQASLGAAQEALAHTPEQLPVLREAGVVDAGGQGVVAFMAGALAYLQGKTDATLDITTPVQAGSGSPGHEATDVSHDFLEHTEEEAYGYCTQLLIRGADMDVDSVRDQIAVLGRSTVVVGDDSLIKVHTHVLDPGPVVSLGTSLGTLDQVKIENMDTMHQEFMALHGYVQSSNAVAVVAVASGDGLEQVFRDLGAAAVVRGGQTMNPSAQEILEAVQGMQAQQVVVLPNNPNILMAAQQAAELCENPCAVLASRTIPQGIAALIAYNPDLDADANVKAMTTALSSVRSGEVTVAVRDATINGVSVSAGQAIALLDGTLTTAGATTEEALLGLLEHAGVSEGDLVTLYGGADVSSEALEQNAETIRQRWPEIEVEAVDGGQPHYQYLVSIE